MTRSVLAFVLALAVASPVVAQQLVPVGARVRIRLDEPNAQNETRLYPVLVLRGEVTAESADSLWLRPTRATGVIGISKPGIRTLATSLGPPRRLRSMIVDGIGGFIVGALEGYIIHNLILRDGFGDSPGDAALTGGMIGGGTFALIGFLFPIEYWRRVRLD